MHTYRTGEFKEDFKEIEESDQKDQLEEKDSDDEGIIKDQGSDSEDRKNDNPIQEFPTRESEIEGTEESEPYKTEHKVIKKTTMVIKTSSGMLERPK